MGAHGSTIHLLRHHPRPPRTTWSQLTLGGSGCTEAMSTDLSSFYQQNLGAGIFPHSACVMLRSRSSVRIAINSVRDRHAF